MYSMLYLPEYYFVPASIVFRSGSGYNRGFYEIELYDTKPYIVILHLVLLILIVNNHQCIHFSVFI